MITFTYVQDALPKPSTTVLIKYDEYPGGNWDSAEYFTGRLSATGVWYAFKEHLIAEGHWERPSIDDNFKQDCVVGWAYIT